MGPSFSPSRTDNLSTDLVETVKSTLRTRTTTPLPREPLKTWPHPPHPFLCLVCNLLLRRQRRSLHKGNSSGQSCLAEVESCQNMKLPNHHLNQGPTHLKPSLSPRPWSPVSLPWPDRDRKPLQHFLLFPAYKFCERKLAITRFQKKKNKPQTPGVPLEESIGSSLKLPL